MKMHADHRAAAYFPLHIPHARTIDTQVPARHAAWGALAALLCSTLLVFSVGAFLQRRVDIGIGLVFTELVCIALPAWVYLRLHPSLTAAGVFDRPPRQDLLRTAAWGIAAIIAATAIGVLTRRALQIEHPGLDKPPSLLGVGLLLLGLWILAPTCEELLFRVALQGGLRTALTARAAVTFTAIAFSVFHGAIERIPETLMLGIFLCILFSRRGNYWLCVALHATCNLFGPLLFAAFSRMPSLAVLILLALFAALATAMIPAKSRPSELADFGPHPRTAIIAALSVFVLTGIGLEVAIYRADAASRVTMTDAPPLGTCTQEWVIQPHDRILIIEDVSPLQPIPPALVPPHPAATLTSCTIDARPVTLRRTVSGWASSELVSRPFRHLHCEWTLGLANLQRDNDLYWTKPRAPTPIDTFRLHVRLDPASGYVFPDHPGQRSITPFMMNVSHGRTLSDMHNTGFRLSRL